MVSARCKMVVREELNKLGLHFVMLDMGVVDVMEDLNEEQKKQIKTGLLAAGLDLIDDKKTVLVEKIKAVIIEMVHYSDELPKTNFSDYLREKINYDYTYMANVFSESQGTTIEKFIISHKIERIKELIMYDELTLTEIAYKMHYSSIAHLSNQFKKETGLNPSHFKKMKGMKRIAIEDI